MSETAFFERKYQLTPETMRIGKHILRRIQAVRDFSDVRAGDLGGWVECDGNIFAGRITKRDNLSHFDDCWLYGEAKSYAGGRVDYNAKLYDNSEVLGRYALVGKDAVITDNVIVDGRWKGGYGSIGAIVGLDTRLSGSLHITYLTRNNLHDEPKYTLTDISKDYGGTTVYRICALRDLEVGNLKIRAGDLGGWVEGQRNLSHNGNCWIANEAVAVGTSIVSDNALLQDHAVLEEDAMARDFAVLRGRASASGDSMIFDHAVVEEFACLHGHSHICEHGSAGGDMEADGGTIAGHARVDGHVTLRDRAVIEDRAYVSGDRVIEGLAWVGGSTWLTRDVQGYNRIGQKEAFALKYAFDKSGGFIVLDEAMKAGAYAPPDSADAALANVNPYQAAVNLRIMFMSEDKVHREEQYERLVEVFDSAHSGYSITKPEPSPLDDDEDDFGFTNDLSI